jgi:hypothetical protein
MYGDDKMIEREKNRILKCIELGLDELYLPWLDSFYGDIDSYKELLRENGYKRIGEPSLIDETWILENKGEGKNEKL